MTPVLGRVQHARQSELRTPLLTLDEASKQFGVSRQVIYRLVELELIDPPLQRGGKGRSYYSERQIRRALTETYFLVAA